MMAQKAGFLRGNKDFRMTWDFSNLINGERPRDRHRSKPKDLRSYMLDWLRVHPSTPEMLASLLPKSLTPKSRLMRVSKELWGLVTDGLVREAGTVSLRKGGRPATVFVGDWRFQSRAWSVCELSTDISKWLHVSVWNVPGPSEPFIQFERDMEMAVWMSMIAMALKEGMWFRGAREDDLNDDSAFLMTQDGPVLVWVVTRPLDEMDAFILADASASRGLPLLWVCTDGSTARDLESTVGRINDYAMVTTFDSLQSTNGVLWVRCFGRDKILVLVGRWMIDYLEDICKETGKSLEDVQD